MINAKSNREIELMRQAGKAVSLVFKTLKDAMKPGMSTQEIDVLAEKIIRDNGCIPTSKGYEGFPGAICISINDTLIHGIPSDKIILKEGDIVSLDVVATYQGYSADACRTYPIGEISDNAKNIIDVTEKAFFEGIKFVKPGNHLGDVSNAIQSYVEKHGYNVVREFTGHGIGKEMHEDPYIPNYGKAGKGPILEKGYALAIEPMVLEGRKDIRILPDGWTVKSRDGKLTCHYENTVIVTDSSCEIITMFEGEM